MCSPFHPLDPQSPRGHEDCLDQSDQQTAPFGRIYRCWQLASCFIPDLASLCSVSRCFLGLYHGNRRRFGFVFRFACRESAHSKTIGLLTPTVLIQSLHLRCLRAFLESAPLAIDCLPLSIRQSCTGMMAGQFAFFPIDFPWS